MATHIARVWINRVRLPICSHVNVLTIFPPDRVDAHKGILDLVKWISKLSKFLPSKMWKVGKLESLENMRVLLQPLGGAQIATEIRIA